MNKSMKSDNDLLNHLDKLHTTELGVERIKRNELLFKERRKIQFQT